MQISILTPDSKIPNLAAMKISAWHKQNGDNVELNFPLIKSDMSYASILFSWTHDPIADIVGGPKYPHIKLEPEFDAMKPDYSIYPNIDYSIGYTYKACPRTCDFCIVPKQANDENHYSIWTFHDSKFKKISLMNNNTLADHRWRETFEEIIDADLTVIDHNGYDLRLMTDESAYYMSKVKWQGLIHVAWDYIDTKDLILKGLVKLIKYGLRNKIHCYVMIGHTTEKEDLYRVERLRVLGIDPYVMPMNKNNNYQKRFARWCNHKAIFKTVKWKDYHY